MYPAVVRVDVDTPMVESRNSPTAMIAVPAIGNGR